MEASGIRCQAWGEVAILLAASACFEDKHRRFNRAHLPKKKEKAFSSELFTPLRHHSQPRPGDRGQARATSAPRRAA